MMRFIVQYLVLWSLITLIFDVSKRESIFWRQKVNKLKWFVECLYGIVLYITVLFCSAKVLIFTICVICFISFIVGWR